MKRLNALALSCALVAGTTAWAVEPANEVKKEKHPPGVSRVQEIEEYINHFLEGTHNKDRRRKRAPELARLIVEEAEAAGVDPLVLAIILKRESSFYEARGGDRKGLTGKIGERGLGQLHGVAAMRARGLGCDLKTSRGQICGAARWFAACKERCGSVRGGFESYQTGSCETKARGPKLRFSEYRCKRFGECMKNGRKRSRDRS